MEKVLEFFLHNIQLLYLVIYESEEDYNFKDLLTSIEYYNGFEPMIFDNNMSKYLYKNKLEMCLNNNVYLIYFDKTTNINLESNIQHLQIKCKKSIKDLNYYIKIIYHD